VLLWHSLHSLSFVVLKGLQVAGLRVYKVLCAVWVICLKWVAPSRGVRNLVVYLSSTISQFGVGCLMLSILWFHSLGEEVGVRLSFENSSVSCFEDILSRGDPTTLNEGKRAARSTQRHSMCLMRAFLATPCSLHARHPHPCRHVHTLLIVYVPIPLSLFSDRWLIVGVFVVSARTQ
jgi:hypothetical protein